MRSKYLELNQLLINKVPNNVKNSVVTENAWERLVHAQSHALKQCLENSESGVSYSFTMEDLVVHDDSTTRIPSKQCTGPCKRVLEQTKEHFRVDKSKNDGFQSRCKQCRSQKRKRPAPTPLDDLAKMAAASHVDFSVLHVNQCDLGNDPRHAIELMLRRQTHVCGVIVTLTNDNMGWKQLEQCILNEGGDMLCDVAIQGPGETLEMSLATVNDTLSHNPNLSWYQRDFSLEERLPKSYLHWSCLFNPLMGVIDVNVNLLLLLKPENSPKIHHCDDRDCFYLTVYYYLGGQGTFAALHQDTLGIPAGNVVLRGRKEQAQHR